MSLKIIAKTFGTLSIIIIRNNIWHLPWKTQLSQTTFFPLRLTTSLFLEISQQLPTNPLLPQRKPSTQNQNHKLNLTSISTSLSSTTTRTNTSCTPSINTRMGHMWLNWWICCKPTWGGILAQSNNMKSWTKRQLQYPLFLNQLSMNFMN